MRDLYVTICHSSLSIFTSFLADTQIANEIRLGHIPEWTPGQQVVPQIAKDYWRMPENATMLDLILQVRAELVFFLADCSLPLTRRLLVSLVIDSSTIRYQI